MPAELIDIRRLRHESIIRSVDMRALICLLLISLAYAEEKKVEKRGLDLGLGWGGDLGGLSGWGGDLGGHGIQKEVITKIIDRPVHVPVKVAVPVPHAVPVPYPVIKTKTITVPVEKPVPYPVKVPVPAPYPVEKKVPYPVAVKVPVPQPYPVHIEKPYPVPVKVPVPVIQKVVEKVPVVVKESYGQGLSGWGGHGLDY